MTERDDVSPAQLPVSLVLVSDFEPGEKSWSDEIAAVECYAFDPEGVPNEIIITAQTEEIAATAPKSWQDAPIKIRVIAAGSSLSSKQKDVATALALNDLVAVVEADCLAEKGWLAKLYRRITNEPAIDVVSGLTIYEPLNSMRRVMSLYQRAYAEHPGKRGVKYQVANNGALYKKSILEKFLYSSDESPFVSAHKRLLAMREAGVRTDIVREAVQYHAFGGWPFIADVHRNRGFQMVRMAQERNRYAGALYICFRLFLGDLKFLLLYFARYCKWRDLPMAILFLFATRDYEWDGARIARTGAAQIPSTDYR